MIPSGAIYLVSGVTDMRKSIDGLSIIVADVLKMDPLSEAWFIFCNRGRAGIPTGSGSTIVAWKRGDLNGQNRITSAIFISPDSNLIARLLKGNPLTKYSTLLMRCFGMIKEMFFIEKQLIM